VDGTTVIKNAIAASSNTSSRVRFHPNVASTNAASSFQQLRTIKSSYDYSKKQKSSYDYFKQQKSSYDYFKKQSYTRSKAALHHHHLSNQQRSLHFQGWEGDPSKAASIFFILSRAPSKVTSAIKLTKPCTNIFVREQ